MKNHPEIELTILIAMMIIIAYSWYKNEKSVWKSFLYTIFTCGVFYLNAPNFLTITEDLSLKNAFFSLPFELYNKFGTIYIAFTNILLTIVGLYLGHNGKQYAKKSKIKHQFDCFVSDATSIKIIGRDLDFLLENDPQYDIQRNKIRSLGDRAKLLCSWTDNKDMIGLYYDLLACGNKVKAYKSSDVISNLKGQIKVNEHNEKLGIFLSKTSQPANTLQGMINNIPVIGKRMFKTAKQSPSFELTEMGNGFLLDAVDQQFDRTFANSLHPVIRCIALDLGGVFFDGNIDDFYTYLKSNHSIHMKKKVKDRLNIDNDLMLGKITIKDFIIKRTTSMATVKKLNTSDWEDILTHWQKTWKPNSEIKQIVLKLSELGYHIVPFSNLDKENGEKYIRDHLLPECCTCRWFSFERKKSKPNLSAFKDFSQLVMDKGYIQMPYQILLIDDEPENINAANSLGWNTIQFYNNPPKSTAINLLSKLKQGDIIPAEYNL